MKMERPTARLQTGASSWWWFSFTLYVDCSEGNRPSFFRAGAPDLANRLYEHVVSGAGCMWIRWSMESSEPICR